MKKNNSGYCQSVYGEEIHLCNYNELCAVQNKLSELSDSLKEEKQLTLEEIDARNTFLQQNGYY